MRWVRSIAAPETVGALVGARCGLTVHGCDLVRSLTNDVYRVRTAAGDVACKVYGAGRWSAAQVAWEQDLAAHLAAAGVTAAAPVPLADGTLVGVLDAPEGPRPFTVTAWTTGAKPRPPWSDGLFHRYGAALARLHLAADGLVSAHPPKVTDPVATLDAALARIDNPASPPDPAPALHRPARPSPLDNPTSPLDPAPALDSPAPPLDSSVSPFDSPASATGDLVAERGGPASDTGGLDADSGGPASDTGGLVADSGGPASDTGGPASGGVRAWAGGGAGLSRGDGRMVREVAAAVRPLLAGVGDIGVRHGDASLDNVQVGGDGVLLWHDFDLAAVGPRAADLTGAHGGAHWPAFLDGYASLRPADTGAVLALRVVELVGNIAWHLTDKVALRGTESVAEGWVERELTSLRELRDRL